MTFRVSFPNVICINVSFKHSKNYSKWVGYIIELYAYTYLSKHKYNKKHVVLK